MTGEAWYQVVKCFFSCIINLPIPPEAIFYLLHLISASEGTEIFFLFFFSKVQLLFFVYKVSGLLFVQHHYFGSVIECLSDKKIKLLFHTYNKIIFLQIFCNIPTLKHRANPNYIQVLTEVAKCAEQGTNID